MKILTLLVAASALAASSVSANIGDVDATIDEIKTSAVFVAQPLSVTNRVLAAQDTTMCRERGPPCVAHFAETSTRK